jgi:hypothetical protein
LLLLIGGLCDLGEGLRRAGRPEGLGLRRHSLRARFLTSTVHSGEKRSIWHHEPDGEPCERRDN